MMIITWVLMNRNNCGGGVVAVLTDQLDKEVAIFDL